MEKSILISLSPEELRSYIEEAVIKALAEKPKLSAIENANCRLTRKEVSKQYSIGLSKLHHLMRTGKLPYEKLGKKTLFLKSDVDSYFESLKRGSSYEQVK